MSTGKNGFIEQLLSLPLFHAEWVLFLLIGLSLVSVAVIIERLVFYRRHRVDVERIRVELGARLDAGDFSGAAAFLSRFDSLETNAVLFGLQGHAKGPQSVEELIGGAARKERSRFEERLPVLATIASNAPFIGLFGTVLGIIRAFGDMSSNMGEASGAVMGGIAEALIATAVGLLVAIPAVVAFNTFKSKVGRLSDDMQLLAATLMASLKATTPAPALVPVRSKREA